MTLRTDFRMLHRLRVRWAEVDMQAIVFNAHYLMYMDVAMTEYWRASALPFTECMHQLGGDMVVRKATVDFIASARMDDVLDIGMRFLKAGKSSMVFQAAVFRGQEVLATGELLYVYTLPGAKSSQPVPQILLDALAAFEAGQTMTDLQVATWAELSAQVMPLRHAVFAVEKGVAADTRLDANDVNDAKGFHALVSNRVGVPVATGRLILVGQTVQIGGMAVCHPLRSLGLGAQVLTALLEQAQAMGVQSVMLNALTGAVAFYARHGFVPLGDAFEEAGLTHQPMVLTDLQDRTFS